MNQTRCQKRYGVYAAKGGETTKKAIPFFVIIATVLCCAPQAPIVVEKPKVAPTSEIGRDGHFVLHSNGVVKDTKTGLEWAAGPDRDMTWDQAHSWVESLTVDGGGWRMPTLDELKSLYQQGRGKRNMTQLLKTTGWYVWSGEAMDSSQAWVFYFKYSPRHNYDVGTSHARYCRAFAVRSRR